MEEKHKFDKDIENHISRIIYDEEYKKGQQNQQAEIDDFQAVIDLFDAIRTEKDYDWMSDIFLPEFPSQMLTQSAIDVSQYFQTRDFVEGYVQDERQEALDAAEATQELINRTLNRRNLYHYQKFVRAKNINHFKGSVILEACWEKETTQVPQWNDEVQDYEYDENGQIIYDTKTVTDQFQYDIIDPRNVFMDSKYCYSLQDKDFVTIRTQKTLQKLREDAERFGYFNLDLVEKLLKPDVKTEGEKDIEDQTRPQTKPKNKISDNFDIYKRYGKFWITKDGRPGVDKDGKVLDKATLEEVVMSVCVGGGTKILIQFHRQPYRDANGKQYKPVIRGMCYIHPTNDNGMGDGKYARELQVALNDTFNLSNDRTRLATLPTLSVRRGLVEDTDSIYFEPGHPMERNDKDDIVEFKIQDNIQGALNQIMILKNQMQEVSSIYPTTMGNLPDQASTTATAIVGARQQSNQRSNYKTMTFEFTALIELYWMIQQMTWQFADPETGEQLMGQKVVNFNPKFDYFYKPLSQSIETEESKGIKIQRWTTVLQTMASMQHPDTVKAVNYILTRIAELMRDEYVNFAVAMFNPKIPIQTGRSAEGGGAQVSGASNQYGLPMGGTQTMAREAANESGLPGI